MTVNNILQSLLPSNYLKDLLPVNCWQICCGNKFLPNFNNSDHCIISSIFSNFLNIRKFKICKKDDSNLTISQDKFSCSIFWTLISSKIYSSSIYPFGWSLMIRSNVMITFYFIQAYLVLLAIKIFPKKNTLFVQNQSSVIITFNKPGNLQSLNF